MERTVNLFDLSTGMAGNNLLTEKTHQNGSPLSRSQTNAAKAFNPIGYQVEDKSIGYESRRSSSNKKSSGIPMKLLIAQELSKETESKHKPPSVVAKLMGLDAPPGKQPDSTTQRGQPKGYLQNSPTQPGMRFRYQQQENGFLDKQMQHGIDPSQGQKEYRDVYEVWQQSPKNNYINDKLPQKGGHNENINEKKMALVRQKFIEAKRLATDEKLRQSKEFQDVLEVLSSNKDLFLKCLQEPDPMFSQHLYELQSIPPPPQTKRITVLKPSKTMENNRFAGREKKSEKQIKKQTQLVEANGWDKNEPSWSSVYTNQKVDSSVQPTRIVVLKPSPGKTHDIKSVVSSLSSSPRLLHDKDYYREPEDDETLGSREVAKEITRQMCESLSSHQRNQNLLSSVFSNGYVGDESSFNKSEKEYIEVGNLSDSEVIIPTSRHSWDFVNRFGSPYSSYSFSWTSYSPESLVCREAKKRLSERWAMMTSKGSGPEQRQVWKSSSTLGEMLALSDTKKSTISGEEACGGELSVLSGRSCGGEQDLMAPTLGLQSSRNNEENGEDSPRNLLRSRSVPVSSTAYGTRLNVEVPDPVVGKSIVPKEVAKSKSGKFSFKGKVSSLIFSSKKKPSKVKSSTSSLAGSQDESPSTPSNQLSLGKTSNHILYSVTKSGHEGELASSMGSPPASIYMGTKNRTFSHEALLSIAKPSMLVDNRDQPSPISILEAPFKDNINTIPQPSGNVKSDHQGGQPLHLQPLKSNLIDKSPPIESMARTLSWVTARPNSLNPSRFPSNAEEEEQEQILFVQTLLSAAGLEHEDQSGVIFSRWHSPDSPLEPSFLDKFVDPQNEKAQLHEAKRRQKRSNQRLLFDCVNAALVDMTSYGLDASPWTTVSSTVRNRPSIGAPVTVDEVWGRVRECFYSKARCMAGESEDNNNLVVRKEVAGKWWEDLYRLEVDLIGKEIERDMLEELVDEALIELTGRL